MSHFTVLVIGEDVEKQLQPFHEYESTGIEDEYVVDVNKNEEVKEFFNSELFVGKSKEKNELDYSFSEESAEKYLTDIKKMSRLEYFKLKNLNESEIEQEIIDYHGFNKVGDDWFRRTNPNAEWDWWVVGGRWSGFFKLKEGKTGELGKKSLLDTTPHESGTADIVRKGDVDFEHMRGVAEKRAIKEYDLVFDATDGTPEPESWDSVRTRLPIDEARSFYNSQPRIEAFKNMTKQHENIFGWFSDYEDYNCSRGEYIKRERNRAMTTYTYVKDSQWYSKGKMGWWGFSDDKITQDDWNEHYNDMIDSLPDDTLLTLVDCHI